MAASSNNLSNTDLKSSWDENHGVTAKPSLHPSYRNRDISWINRDGVKQAAHGASKDGDTIQGEDIILIAKEAEGYHQIYSLHAKDPLPDPATKELSFGLRITSVADAPDHWLDDYLFKGLPAHLGPDNKIHVLISTLSGVSLALKFFDEVLKQILETIGLDSRRYAVTTTSSSDSVKEFAESTLLPAANTGMKQTVLMLSGDGGVVDTLNGLLEHENRSEFYTRPILSQLPLGTANALFHSLHKPSPISSHYIQGLRTLLHGTPRPLPIFSAKFSPGARLLTNEGQKATPLATGTLYGAVVASYGLHSTLVADSDTPEYRKHGEKRFGMVAQDLLFGEGKMPHAYKATVTLFRALGEPQVIPRDEHGYVLATLVSNLEKTFAISPASQPLDGRIRVIHFGPTSGNRAMEYMSASYDGGKHVEMEGLGYSTVEALEIVFREEGEGWNWRRCCIDGLIVGVEEGGWMLVRGMTGKEAVEVLVDF